MVGSSVGSEGVGRGDRGLLRWHPLRGVSGVRGKRAARRRTACGSKCQVTAEVPEEDLGMLSGQ